MNTADAAKLLIDAIQAELDRGVRHYDPRNGSELTTVREVLLCLRDTGEVRLYFPSTHPRRDAERN